MLTGDIWTSIAVDSYLTLTLQYISTSWERCSAVFRTKLLDDRHTGANIVIWMEEMLSSYDISVDKVIALFMIVVLILILQVTSFMINMVGILKLVLDTRSSFVLRQA